MYYSGDPFIQPYVSPTLTYLVSSPHVVVPSFQFQSLLRILPFKDEFQEVIFKHNLCLLLTCTSH